MYKTTLRFLCLFCFLILFTSPIYAQGVKREIEWSDYPYPIPEGLKERLKFGHIIVPETRNSDNPRKLKIAFCILKGENQNGLENPIILLPGGPGGSMTQAAAYYLNPADHWKERMEFSDVVFFDPRGCGKSEPDLCPDMDKPEYMFQALMGKTEAEINQETVRVLTKCLDSLILEKVNLNSYGSDEVAEDIEDLRVSLEIDKWNIQGGSYGTRYGQGVIRKFPQSVRSAVFSGLVPTVRNYMDDNLLSFSSSLQLTLQKCKEDPDCAASYPDLENQLFNALEYYNANPLIIPPKEQKLLKNHDVYINGNVIISGIFQLSYDPIGIEIIPNVIKAAVDKKEWVIKNFVNSIGDMFAGNQDMLLYIRCNDNPTYGLRMEASLYDDFTKKLMPYFLDRKLKSELEQGILSGIRLDTVQEVPIPSDIPVLLSTGIFDPITPPENSVITSKYLTNSVVLEFPGTSHWSRGNICYSNIVTKFYKNPEIPLNANACLKEAKPVVFVTDIADNKGITQIGSKILMGKENQVYVPMGLALLLVVIGFLGMPIYALINFLKKRKNKDLEKIKIHWLPWIITLMVVVFIGLLYLGISASIDRNQYILGFGILSSWSWIFWLVYVILGLLFFALLKRKLMLDGTTNRFSKSLALISWCGSFIFVCLMFYWNLLWPLSG